MDDKITPDPGPRLCFSPCLGCQRPLDWSKQKRQWGRAVRQGLTREEARAACPRCQKCMTAYLNTFVRAYTADDFADLVGPDEKTADGN